jgi:hypothetical protein
MKEMKKLIVLFCITIFLFSCTIEKRHYFKGYHVENGRMGKRGPSTGSGTARSTGSGTGEAGPFDRLRDRGSVAVIQAQEPEEGERKHIAAQEKTGTNAASTAIEVQKPQSADTPKAGDDVKDDNEIKTERTLPQVSDTETEGDVSRGGDVGDPNPDENRPHGPWGLIIPCIIFSGFTVLFLIQLGSSTIELSTFLGLLLLAGAASILAILFGVLAIIRIIQLYNYDKGKESTTPGQYSE